MDENFSFPALLRQELHNRKQANSNYSLRAFARSLRLSPSYLSKLMTGKRAASEETFLKIGAVLNLSDEKLNRLSENRSFKVVDAQFESIQTDQFRTIADWHHFAILEAVTLSDFEPSPHWIAKRLSISEERAKSALERLIRLGFLKVDKNGKILTSVSNHSSLSQKGISSAQTEHERQVLEGALMALQKIPTDQRLQSSMTLAVPESRLKEANEKIKKFRRELMVSLQRRGARDTVYQLSIAFYPVTIKENK